MKQHKRNQAATLRVPEGETKTATPTEPDGTKTPFPIGPDDTTTPVSIDQIKTIPAPIVPGETKTATPTEPDATKTPVPESIALASPEPDEQCCFRCLKPLLKETTTAKRMRFKCCGEAMHLDCLQEAFQGKTPTYFRENDPICPCCNKLYPAYGSDEEWAIASWLFGLKQVIFDTLRFILNR